MDQIKCVKDSLLKIKREICSMLTAWNSMMIPFSSFFIATVAFFNDLKLALLHFTQPPEAIYHPKRLLCNVTEKVFGNPP